MSPTRRNSLRLPCYDYRAGWFFLTLCTWGRRPLFGQVCNARLELTDIGQCVSDSLRLIPVRRPGCLIHEFALMPDHLHAIVELRSHQLRGSPRASAGLAGGIGTVVGLFKRGVSLEILERGIGDDEPVWQRGYYDRVIRSDHELNQTRRYIQENTLASVVGLRLTNRRGGRL